VNAPQHGNPEIARGLADALRPALVANAPVIARIAARDVAQVLGLAGLDEVLAELDRHAGPSRPAEVEHVAGRLARLADSAESEGSLAAFWSADPELAALAAHLRGIEWTSVPAARAHDVATLSVTEVLADLPLEATSGVERARITAAVAASLRAALDWIGADTSSGGRVEAHDSALTLTATVSHEGGIGPAGAVLASIEGSLGREADGRWTMRVPLFVERPSYLLVRQGRLALALPWHAVARLRMVPTAGPGPLAEPVLDPLAKLGPTGAERPAALMALGLARAWMIADRIVWRVVAHPEEADVPSPIPGATHVVNVESGERYWIVEPAWLLRGVAAPDVPPPAPRPRADSASRGPTEELPVALEPMPPPEGDDPAEAMAAAAERALAQLRTERSGAPASRVAPRPPGMPHRGERPAPPEVPAPGDVPAPAPPPEVPAPGDPPEPPAAAAPSTMFSAQLTVLRPADVRPIDAPAAPTPATPPPGAHTPPAGVAGPSPAAPPPSAHTPAPAAPASRTFARPRNASTPPTAPALRPSELAHATSAPRALIADDSMVARIFLARLLERRGIVVETVADAAGMWAELARGPWTFVFADFAMPDAQGREHVARLLEHRAASAEPYTLVVLSRDAEDERVAIEGGVTRLLRKPFEAEALDRLLER